MSFRSIGSLATDVLAKAEKRAAAANSAAGIDARNICREDASSERAPEGTALRRIDTGNAERNGNVENGREPIGEAARPVVRQKGGPDDFGALIAVKTKTTRRRPRANSALKGLSPAVPALGLRLVAVDGKLVHTVLAN